MVPATRRPASAGTLAGIAWSLLNWLPVLAFIAAPLAGFLIYSVFSVRDGEILYRPTIVNYQRFFIDGLYPSLFLRTCGLALGVSALTLALGYPIAFFLSQLRGRMKYALVLAFAVPMLMSYIIKIYAIRAILGSRGMLNQLLIALGIIGEPSTLLLFNLGAVLVTLSVILLPFTILPIFVALERIPASLFEASADLGAASWATIRRVVMPLSRQGAVTGGVFTFVLALGDFVTPQMVGGPTGMTFGRVVYSQFGLAFNWPFGAALATIMSVVVLLAMWLANWSGRVPGAAR